MRYSLHALALLTWLTGTVVVLAQPAPVPDAVLLRHRFTVGQRFEYRIRQDSEFSLAVGLPGLSEKKTAALRSEVTLSIRTVSGGESAGTIAVRGDRMVLEAEYDGQKHRFDTRPPRDEKPGKENQPGRDAQVVDELDLTEPALRLIRGAVNHILAREFTAELDTRGQVTGAAGFRKLAEELLGDFGLPADREQLDRIDERLLAAVLTRPLRMPFPADAVKPGQSWSAPLLPEYERLIWLTVDYTMRGWDIVDGQRVARIGFRLAPGVAGVESLKWELPLPMLQGLDITAGVKALKADGDLVVAVADGRLMSAKIDLKLSASAGAELPANRAGAEFNYDGRLRIESSPR